MTVSDSEESTMKLFSSNNPAGLQPREHRALYVLLSFFLPALVLTLALIGLRITPFGDKHNLAITDAKYYINGLLSFSRLLRGVSTLPGFCRGILGSGTFL